LPRSGSIKSSSTLALEVHEMSPIYLALSLTRVFEFGTLQLITVTSTISKAQVADTSISHQWSFYFRSNAIK